MIHRKSNIAVTPTRRDVLYGLGATLYFLLTGRKLFDGESIIEKIMAHQQRQVPAISAVCPDIPPELETIFLKMVAKQPL